MDDLATWFCLRGRPSFTIEPQINADDAQYYFGREEIKQELETQIRFSFVDPGVPKMMVWGPYGSGKTQTLLYLEYHLKNRPPKSLKGKPHTVYLKVEMKGNSTASYLHMKIMEKLGKESVGGWVKRIFDASSDLDSTLATLTTDPNVMLALKELRGTGERTFVAWRWLTGQGLRPIELSSLQLTRNLGDLGAGDLADTLIAVGKLASAVGEKLIFLMDEFEELQNVKAGDAAESIHQYLRSLADSTNADVGFLIGFKADVLDDAAEILRRGDVQGRIGMQNYVDIPPLPAVSNVKAFMREMLQNLTDVSCVQKKISERSLDTEPGIFPFERTAFEMMADYATQEITRALPRFIIKAINQCAIEAWDTDKPLITEEVVNRIAPRVFETR